MKRRDCAALLAAGLAGGAPWALAEAAEGGAASSPAASRADASAAGRKLLRVAFNTAETGFDPATLQDIYSRSITPHIFEALYHYDHLARPSKIKPLLADGMPEVSADFKVWTVRVKPGIYFASDPAFKGQRREMVAKDHAYALMRTADPALKSQIWTWVETFKIEGLADYRREVVAAGKPFDYDRRIPGLLVIDRHTLRYTLTEPNPRFLEQLASSDLIGAQAREVVEFYGDKIAEHPVGTGPFRLKQWRRSSLIVLERSPDYRERFYDAEPAADDAEGQALIARFKGRRLPMVDEVQVSIIGEDQPRWLSFLNAQIDILGGKYGAVPGSFISVAMPKGQVAPNLARRGIRGRQQVNPDVVIYYFNMEDPVVGGYTPDKVALRRAIGLAMDVPREISAIRRSQAVPAQSMVAPYTTGYDPDFKSEAGEYDPARARALLDLYGYIDRDGDGFRELPDGQPLTLEYATQSELINRQFDELLRKNMAAVGIRVNFQIGQWPEQAKQARAGKLMMWLLGSSATSPDGQGTFQRLHGPQAGGQNLARFKLPAFDAIYDRMSQLPDGPERQALFLQAKKIAVAYMPYKPTVHRISTDMWHPWVIGFRRPPFHNEWWHMVDIDTALQAKAGA